jgi:hypothetical protein
MPTLDSNGDEWLESMLLQLMSGTHQEVLWLEVSVDHVHGMAVVDHTDNGAHHLSSLQAGISRK